jgi:hypothetical protein
LQGAVQLQAIIIIAGAGNLSSLRERQRLCRIKFKEKSGHRSGNGKG